MSSPILSVAAALDTVPLPRTKPSEPLALPTLIDIVQGIAKRPSLWEHRVQYSSTNRWWTQLVADKNVDVWLLSWLTSQETELHDHGTSSAAFTVVQGALAEVRVGAYGAIDLNHVAAASNSVQWVAPGTIHDVSNPFDVPAVSIHAYSPPLKEMTYYKRTHDGIKAVRTEPVYGPERY